MKKVLFLIAILLAPIAQAEDYAIYQFYRDPATPLIGTSVGCCYDYPGSALSGSSIPFHFDKMAGRQIKFARWVLVWNPSTGGSPTGARLVHADSGPSNLVQIADIRTTNKSTPIVSSADITNELNALSVSGQWKQILQQTFGNGGNGIKIYGSWVEIVWE